MDIVPQFFYTIQNLMIKELNKMTNATDKELNKPRDAKYLIRFSI